MNELFEYHLRGLEFDDNGYRIECIPEGGTITFFSEMMEGLKIILDPNFNLELISNGKICVSEEMGFLHIYFEEEKFSETESEEIVREFKRLLESYFDVELEFFRSN